MDVSESEDESYNNLRKIKTKKDLGMGELPTLTRRHNYFYDGTLKQTEYCSQCSFTAQFASALMMHKELHHDANGVSYPELPSPRILSAKSETLSREASPFSMTKRQLKLPTRSSSATRLFGKLKAKICKSKTLFSHPEEPRGSVLNMLNLSVPSDCTSKAMKVESVISRGSNFITCLGDTTKESYGCHLCSFEADRITVLDRHLLNHHKIGLDNLLKLVMAKTKDGLSEDSVPAVLGLREPYYRQTDDLVDGDEFIIETIEPKIKILKHSGTNTDLKMTDMNKLLQNDDFDYETTTIKIPDKIFEKEGFEDNLKMFSNELDNMMKYTKDSTNDEVLSKMKVLNDCMFKFVDSSNAIRKVLDSKVNVRTEPSFNLKLDTPREWERAHSEKMDRSSRSKYHEHNRGEKLKISSESFYF